MSTGGGIIVVSIVVSLVVGVGEGIPGPVGEQSNGAGVMVTRSPTVIV